MGDFCFSLPPFSYKWKGRKKTIFLPFPPTQRNARKTPAFPSEALLPLVMKPHHHLNCSILKVCENCTKLIFSHITSICYFCGLSSSLLHFPGAGEQIYMETWGTLMWFGNQKIKVFSRLSDCCLSVTYSWTYVFIFTLGLLKRIWLTDSELNLASGLNHHWAENFIITEMERILDVIWLRSPQTFGCHQLLKVLKMRSETQIWLLAFSLVK